MGGLRPGGLAEGGAAMRTRVERFHGCADLVLEGGGVGAVALAGALSALHDKGYRFDDRARVAGASAGALVAALVAAGVPVPRLAKLVTELDYRQLRDRGALGLRGGASGWMRPGPWRGDRLHRWVGERLAECGVHTFGDLRVDDPGSCLPAGRGYRLVVLVSDVTTGLPVRLPWDYRRYGLDPDRQPVADAVRACASTPFVPRPVRVRPPGGGPAVLWTDGRELSGFPVAMFDRTDGAPPRWPTFGVKLAGRTDAERRPAPRAPAVELGGPARTLLRSMVDEHDRRRMDDPAGAARTIVVDTMGVRATDVDLGGDKLRELYYRGRGTAEAFLAGWDFARYRSAQGG
jgi:NTE family protein